MNRVHIYYKVSAVCICLSALLLASCYRLISTCAPAKATAGETFEVSFTVVDDGSDVQNFVTDWSYAGVRVPKGWTVTVPTGAHQQFAEDWVYYQDGTKVNAKQNMKDCPRLTDFYNSACPKSGYEWHAFQSQKRVSKNISACWRNGCDSIRITFLVTVPEDAAAGKYQIDFIGGDEEDEQGVDKYASHTDAKGSRLFHVGTVSSSYIENRNTAMSRTIEITDKETAIHGLTADAAHSEAVYSLDGRLLRRPGSTKALKAGTYIVGGRKTVVK